MSKKKKIIISSIVGIVIVLMVIFNLTKSRGNTIEVSVEKVERGDITKTVSGSGYVQPELDVDIAARISAELIKLHVIEGDEVKKGQLLVELDRQRYEAQVEQAESQQMSARAALKKAEADYTRTRDLFEKELTSQADLDAVEAQRMSAESQLRQAAAYLKQARDDLAKTRLVSPIDGTVTRLLKEEGEIAVGSQFQADPIMTVSDLSRMEVLAEIDENDVVLVDLGQETDIEIDAIPDTVFKGRVSEIAHTATTRGRGTQEQVTNFEVKIAVTSQVEKLRPGMTATVDIRTETHEQILYVPIQCVTVRSVKADSAAENVSEEDSSAVAEPPSQAEKDEDKDDDRDEVVFVVEEGTTKMVPVETGISDDNNIEILSGLEEGQKVVSGSYRALSRDLKDGSKIKEKQGMSYKNEDSD